MNDLLIFIRNLLVTDPTLISLFFGAGQDSVIACLPNQRDLAIYPCITYYGEDGEEYNSGDRTPKVFTGKFCMEIWTRQSPVDLSNYATMLAIKDQICTLLIGNRLLGTTGISGTFLSRSWTLCVFRAMRPNGPGPVIDPTLARWTINFKTVLMEPR